MANVDRLSICSSYSHLLVRFSSFFFLISFCCTFSLFLHTPAQHFGLSMDQVPLHGLLELNNVTFHYPQKPEVCVLNRLKLTVLPNSTLALVGPPGSGKSTVLKILQRLYENYMGTVVRNISSFLSDQVCFRIRGEAQPDTRVKGTSGQSLGACRTALHTRRHR